MNNLEDSAFNQLQKFGVYVASCENVHGNIKDRKDVSVIRSKDLNSIQLVVTELFGGPVEDCGGFTRSGLRYRLALPISSVVAEEQGVANTGSSVVILSSVPNSLIWDMDGMYGAIKGPRRYYGGVSTSGSASDSIIEGTSGADGVVTSRGSVSIANGNMSGDASGIPLLSPNPEFLW
ncbi:hypothetical protein AXG93_3891s1270 [Marchantia polymorpha subsp. ruderalis]|uniref:Uncharacterized protein n=1 Tax=Marchantia polymorpha subsp. ruderalis TaxID=1480154 RepID=A0A176WMC1_MARPO|nr:hypothetical protein AXG93_3891s1270 [Marchantia polymorpha subsp. ruderalis]